MKPPFFLGRRIIVSTRMMGVESSPKAIGFKIGTRNEFATEQNPFRSLFVAIFTQRHLGMSHEEGSG